MTIISLIICCVLLPSLLQATTPDYPHQLYDNKVCGPTVDKLPERFVNSCQQTGYGLSFCQNACADFTKAFSGKDPGTVKRRYKATIITAYAMSWYPIFATN